MDALRLVAVDLTVSVALANVLHGRVALIPELTCLVAVRTLSVHAHLRILGHRVGRLNLIVDSPSVVLIISGHITGDCKPVELQVLLHL